MDEVKCEQCPISSECEVYKEAEKDNALSYHLQSVVRVWSNDCPLLNLVKEYIGGKL